MINISYSKYKKIYIIVYFLVLLFWLYFIFSNSMSSATESSEQSTKVVEFTQKIVSTFDKDAVVEPSAIRTSAHFFEFFVLGGIYYVGTYLLEKRSHFMVSLSIGISLLTALVDETLQLSSPGRGAEVTDVWVDFLGALCAHFVIIFTITLMRLIKKKIT